MKKYSLVLAAAAALLTFSCSVDPVDVADVQPEEDGEITVLTATFAGADDETRTVRQADEAAVGGLRQFRIAGQQPGRDRTRRHGDAAASALVAFQHGQFRTRDGAVGT